MTENIEKRIRINFGRVSKARKAKERTRLKYHKKWVTHDHEHVNHLVVACRGGTLHPFCARASHRARAHIQRNDTALRHKFAQAEGTKIHIHGRVQPAAKRDGVPASAACERALGGTLLPFDIRAFHHVRIWRNDVAPRTRKFSQAMEMPSNHTTHPGWDSHSSAQTQVLQNLLLLLRMFPV